MMFWKKRTNTAPVNVIAAALDRYLSDILKYQEELGGCQARIDDAKLYAAEVEAMESNRIKVVRDVITTLERQVVALTPIDSL